jgi:hypothetical protein
MVPVVEEVVVTVMLVDLFALLRAALRCASKRQAPPLQHHDRANGLPAFVPVASSLIGDPGEGQFWSRVTVADGATR